MSWDARQRRMLEAMGIRLWAPARPSADADADAVEDTLVAQRDVDAEPCIEAPRLASSPIAPAPMAAMDWPALREAVSGCTGCELHRTRANTVFGVGHARAHWMIVGDAPDEPDEREGEPFAGKAGQLLDRMLHAIDVARDDGGAAGRDDLARRAFVANALKCRPPGNRNPTPDEVRRCELHLRGQVELVQPRIVLALGRFAVQSLLGSDEPIGRLRGRVHHYQGRPVIVSYHPAYLLRNPADKARAWDDLCLARETLLAGADGTDADRVATEAHP